jgi:hypothetical protein
MQHFAQPDPEKIHTAQVLEARYEPRLTVSPMDRLIAEWLAERARFIVAADRVARGKHPVRSSALPQLGTDDSSHRA